MALTSNMRVTATELTRFANAKGSAVGTYSQDVGVTGDSSGGVVTLGATWVGDEWGFRPILVLTSVSVETGNPPGNVRFLLQNAGNRRLTATVGFAFSLLAVGAIDHSPEYVVPKVIIEPPANQGGALNQFATCEFTTNTNGSAYHLHLVGIVFDHRRLALSGDWSGVIGLLG